MSFSLFQANLPFRTVIKYLRCVSPAGNDSVDEWATRESESLAVGDILFILDVTRSQFGDPLKGIGVSEGDNFKATAAICVFQQDSNYPMGFALNGDAFEIGFVETVLSARAEEARNSKAGLYMLLARLKEPLTSTQISDLAEMHKKWGNGTRSAAPAGLPDPLYAFLQRLGVAVDPSCEKDPIQLDALAYYLFNDEASAPTSAKIPDLRSKMFGVRKEGSDLASGAEGVASLSLSALFDDAPASAPSAAEPAAKAGASASAGLGISSLFSDWKDDAAPKEPAAGSTAKTTGEVQKPAGSSSPAESKQAGLSALFPDWEDTSKATSPAAEQPKGAGGLGSLFSDWTEPEATPANSMPVVAPPAVAEPPVATKPEAPSAKPASAGLSSLFSNWEETAAKPEEPAEKKPSASDAIKDMFSFNSPSTPTAAQPTEVLDNAAQWLEPPLSEGIAPESLLPPTETANAQAEDFGQMAAALEQVAAQVPAGEPTNEEPGQSTFLSSLLSDLASAPSGGENQGETPSASAVSAPISMDSAELFQSNDSAWPDDDDEVPGAAATRPEAPPTIEVSSTPEPTEAPNSSTISMAATTEVESAAATAPSSAQDKAGEKANSLADLFSDFDSAVTLEEEQATPDASPAAPELIASADTAHDDIAQSEDVQNDQEQIAEEQEDQAAPYSSALAPSTTPQAPPPSLVLPPAPVRTPAQPVPLPAIPGSLTANLLDLKLGSGLMPGGSSGLIAKLEQQAQRAGVRLEEKLIEIQERLVKDRIFNLRKVQIKEEASERNLSNLKSVLFRKVNAAGEDVKAELRSCAEEGRQLLTSFAEGASHGIIQEREALLVELNASPEEVTALSIGGESLIVHLERARQSGSEALDLELKTHSNKLDEVEAEIMGELQARLTRLRERIETSEAVVLAEHQAAITRIATELQEIREFVLHRLDSQMAQLCQSLSRSAELAGLNLSMEADRLNRDVLLERIASAKQTLPTLTLTLREQLRLELDSDAEVRLAEIAPLLSTSKDTIESLEREAVEISVFTGDKEKTDLESMLTELSAFFEERTQEVRALATLTQEELSSIESEIATLSDTSSIESEPEISEARVSVLQRLQSIGNDLNDHVNDSLRVQIANMEDKARALQEDLISSMEADAYSVRKTADTSVQKLRDTAEAIRSRIKAAQEQYIS